MIPSLVLPIRLKADLLRSMIRPFTNEPVSLMVTITLLGFCLLVTFTLDHPPVLRTLQLQKCRQGLNPLPDPFTVRFMA